MGFRDIVDGFDGRLTRTDRRLVNTLLADPLEMSAVPAQEAARTAGVHESAASRLAQKLGFENYRAMRDTLREDARKDIDTAQRLRERLDQMGERSVLEALVESEIRALADLPRQVPAAAMRLAAELLRDAGERLVLGEGHLVSLADLFARRLRRSGYRSEAVGRVDWHVADRLAPMRAGDVIFALAFRRMPQGLDQLFADARASGMKLILMTDQNVRELRIAPDVTLVVSRGAPGESQSLTVPMAVCNALILEISRCDGGRSLQALERLDSTRRSLAGPAARHLFTRRLGLMTTRTKNES